MAEEFFEHLIDCVRREGTRCPGQTIRPEVLDAFMNSTLPQSNRIVEAQATPHSPAKTVVPPRAQTASRHFELPPVTSSEGNEAKGINVSGATLEEMFQLVQSCRHCALGNTRTNAVFGEGNPQARLMFIGEGPGGDEDRLGRPFVGRAGQLLDKMILAMQFTREEVYIANVVKCRPPGNRVPSPDEAIACIGYLKRQIQLIQPEVIVLLGATAVSFLLGKTEGITRLRGKWLAYEGIPVMPTFHPAFLLRQESAKRDAWNDLKMVMKVFGKEPPLPRVRA